MYLFRTKDGSRAHTKSTAHSNQRRDQRDQQNQGRTRNYHDRIGGRNAKKNITEQWTYGVEGSSPRGLVILGMGDDKETDKTRKLLSDAGVTYPQSSGETGNALVYKRFRIDRFPTKALLDPQGKVVALDFDGSFDREHITSTLDKLLPPAQ